MGKPIKKLLFVFFPVLLLQLFVLPASIYNLTAQTTASLVADLLTKVEGRINQAQAEQVNLLSPEAFKKAFEDFQEAKEDDQRGKNQKDILKRLNEAERNLDIAFQKAKTSITVLEPVLKAREAALDANSPQFAPEMFEEAEEEFESAAKKAEDGDTNEARKRTNKIINLYRDAELRAIKENIIGKVHIAIEEAKDAKAEKYAPNSFLKAQTLLQEAENILNTDRNKQSLAREKAEAAAYEASHSIYLSRLVQDYREDDSRWESLILEHEQLVSKVAKEANLGDLNFDNGFVKPVNQIQQAVKSLNTNIKNLQQEVQQKNKDLANLRNEMRELKVELSKLKKVEVDLKDELEAKKRREEKIKRVQSLFTPQEAKVIREGDHLKLRLVGLTFRPAKSNIDAEYFSILTKVQQVIREFPQSVVMIEGHTDSKGHKAANMRLSTARAEAVKTYFQANMGLTDDQIKAVGYGDSRPIAPNTTEDGRRQNRRIDVVLDISKSLDY